MGRPRTCGPLCRCEHRRSRTAEREKNNWQRTLFAASDFGGKCERGYPLSQSNNDKSELAEVRASARGSFDFPSQERLEVGSPDPSPSRSGVSVRLSPHSGSPSQERLGVVPRPLPLRGLRAASPARARSGWKSGRPQPLPLRGLRAAPPTPEARARSGSGPPTPTTPAPGSPCGSRRTPEARREAPGGSPEPQPHPR